MKKNLFFALIALLSFQSYIRSIAVMNNSGDRMYVGIFWGDGFKGGWAKPGQCFRYRSGVDKNQIYACKSSLGGAFTCTNKGFRNTYKHYADGDDSYHVSDDDMLIFSGASLYIDNQQDADKIC